MTKEVSLLSLCYSDFNIQKCFAATQDWNRLFAQNTLKVERSQSGLVYFYGSSGQINVNGKVFHADTGDIFYLPPHVEYYITFQRAHEGLPSSIVLNFHLSDEEKNELILSDCVFLAQKDNQEKYFLTLFQKIVSLFSSPLLNLASVKRHVYQLLAKLATANDSETYSPNEYSLVSIGVSYLQLDGANTCSIAEIAERCHVSEVYFRKLFKKYFHVSPTQFRLTQKINKAKLLLENNVHSITEISDLLGFDNSSYFSKAFKKEVGVSPQSYRKQFTYDSEE